MKVGVKIFVGYLIVILAMVGFLVIMKHAVHSAKEAGLHTSTLLVHAEEGVNKLRAISSQLETLGRLNSVVYSSGYMDRYDQLADLGDRISLLITDFRSLLSEIEATGTEFHTRVLELVDQVNARSQVISTMLMSMIEKRQLLNDLRSEIVKNQKLVKTFEDEKSPLVKEAPGWRELLAKILELEKKARSVGFNPQAAEELKKKTEEAVKLHPFGIWQIEKLWSTSILPSITSVESDLAQLRILAREIVAQPDNEEKLSTFEKMASSVIQNVENFADMGFITLNPVDTAVIMESVREYARKLKKYVEISARQEEASRRYSEIVEKYTATREELNALKDKLSEFFREEFTPLVEEISGLLHQKMMEIRASITDSFDTVKANADTTVINISRIFTITAVVVGLLVIVAFVLTFVLNKNIAGALKHMMHLAQRFSQRDLSEIPRSTERRDEIGKLQNAFVEMAKSLKFTLSDLIGAASILSNQSQSMAASIEEDSATSQEIAATVSEFADRLNGAISRLGEMVGKMEELSRVSEQLNVSASDALSRVEMLTDTIEHSKTRVEFVADTAIKIGNKVEASVQKMGSLNKITHTVSNFVENIRDIAEQTNLLALNAAIEAARAGDAGKGFAVVAEEVRRLAEESARIATSVQESISRVNENVRDAVETTLANLEDVSGIVKDVEEVRKQMDEIVSSVSETTSTIREFASFALKEGMEMREISKHAGEIGEEFESMLDDVSVLKSAVQDSSKVMEELSKSAEKLAELARKLDSLTREYKL